MPVVIAVTIPGICAKSRIKCGDCLHREFLPLADELVRWHLSAKDTSGQRFVVGVYPMLVDETCHFLAIEIDGVQILSDRTASRDELPNRGVNMDGWPTAFQLLASQLPMNGSCGESPDRSDPLRRVGTGKNIAEVFGHVTSCENQF